MSIREKALAYLRTNPLRHLVHLKYLNLYAETVELHYVESGASVGVLLSHPTEAITWDIAAYPQTQQVFLPAASDEKAAALLVEKVNHLVTSTKECVFKFCDPMTTAVFGRAFPMRFMKALLSYTTAQMQPDWTDDGVTVTSALDDACLPLYLTNGYTGAELCNLFDGGALSLPIYEADRPVCTCLTYPNSDTIWEIGGVHTILQARRRGLGRRVVAAALRTLLEQGRIPRYQVEETNLASVKLAESLGLTFCLRFEHYTSAL